MSPPAPAAASSQTPFREYVDTIRVAPARPRDRRALRALRRGHAGAVRPHRDLGRIERWKDANGGKHLRARRRRRPGVRVGDRVYLAPLDIHQPDEKAMEFIRSAVAHGRAVVLRLDVALDAWCESQQTADALHDQVRRGVFLSGARGRVRVSHETAGSPGTTYIGAKPHEEGATLVAYSDAHAAEKNHGRPTCHLELRLVGSRVVRAAVGRALDIEKAWRRVRVVEDLSRVGFVIRREASRGGGRLYAQDVLNEMQKIGLDRRPDFGRAVPVNTWIQAPRNFAPGSTPTPSPSGKAVEPGSVAVVQPRIPQHVRPPDSVRGSGTSAPTPTSSSTPPAMRPLRLRFQPDRRRPPRFRYVPLHYPDKESAP